MQHFLYFFPLPQGQGSFLPVFMIYPICLSASLPYPLLLFHLGDKEGIQGLLIGEQNTLPAVNTEEVGIPIPQTLGVGFISRTLKGRAFEFL